MKKVLGLILVIFFLFSVLPANAGPAYERLNKHQILVLSVHVCLVSVDEFNKELQTAFEAMSKDGGKDQIKMHCLWLNKGRTECYLKLTLTNARSTFSNYAFRDTIKKYPGRFLRNLKKRTLSHIKKLNERLFGEYVSAINNDLRSKGFTNNNLLGLCGHINDDLPLE